MPSYPNLPAAQPVAGADLLAIDQLVGTTARVTGQVTAQALAQAVMALLASGSVTLAGLPTVAGAAGSGIVWNNGGVLCVS